LPIPWSITTDALVLLFMLTNILPASYS